MLMFIRRADIPRPARTLNPSAKLKDTANTETPQLSFQRKAVQDFHSRQADKNDPPSSPTVGADTNVPSSASVVPTPQTITDSDSDDEGGIVGQPTAPCKSSSCPKLTFSLRCLLYSQDEVRHSNHLTGEEKACSYR
jgi:hypothetical protein